MSMNCPYCRTVNDAADNRCARCGRRLHGAAGRPGPELVANSGVANVATALALAPISDPVASPQASTVPTVGGEVQPSLFRDASMGTLGPKVVAIPTLSPAWRPGNSSEREPAKRTRTAPRRTHSDSQQQLDLQEQGDGQAKPQEALYCDARVALTAHRAMAALADGVAVILGSALFLGIAAWAGVDFAIRGNIYWLPAAMIVVVAILYRGIWCLANRDTPGMRFAGLRLVDFDGRTPRRDHRIVRQFAGVLSLVSAGVGLIWALVDEESLTWHDHMSKTFPTIRT